MKKVHKESFATGQDEINLIKQAMERMHDALGVNYTSFHEVMEALDDMRVDLKPTPKISEMVKKFKQRNENLGMESNPVEYWAAMGKECSNVLEAVRLYLEGNAQQLVGVNVLKNRILFLANKGVWK